MRTIADLPPPRAWWGRPEQHEALAELLGAHRDCPHLAAALRESEWLRLCVARALRRDHFLKPWQSAAVVWEFVRLTGLDDPPGAPR